MGAVKQAVALTILSVADGREIVRRAEGELSIREGAVFVKYAEPDPEMGRTWTVLKIREGHIGVVRHGDVRSRQEFIPQRRTGGYYETSSVSLELTAFTHSIEMRLVRGLGTVCFSYDLSVMGEDAGRFTLKLHIAPASER